MKKYEILNSNAFVSELTKMQRQLNGIGLYIPERSKKTDKIQTNLEKINELLTQTINLL